MVFAAVSEQCRYILGVSIKRRCCFSLGLVSNASHIKITHFIPSYHRFVWARVQGLLDSGMSMNVVLYIFRNSGS